MNPILKKSLNIVLDIVIAVLVVFAVLISMVAISSNANNNIPNLFGYSPFSVRTNSMEPTICVGDYIFTQQCDNPAALQKGDIITFYAHVEDEESKQLVKIVQTHRINAVIKTDDSVAYETKGDRIDAPVDDVLVYPGDVIGKYTGVRIPYIGKAIEFLSTKWGFFCLVLLPILLFTLYQIYRLISTVVYNKKVEMAQDVAENASEDLKEAIIAEYLAQQGAGVALDESNDEQVAQQEKTSE